MSSITTAQLITTITEMVANPLADIVLHESALAIAWTALETAKPELVDSACDARMADWKATGTYRKVWDYLPGVIA